MAFAQGSKSIGKITKRENGKIISTGTAVVTFDLIYRPKFRKDIQSIGKSLIITPQ